MTTSKKNEFKEPQYDVLQELKDDIGLASLGLMTNQVWHDDPRRLVFLLSRYKFVSKMLSGSAKVLEVGCGDAFGSRIVLQEVKALTVIDFDPIFIRDINERMDKKWGLECFERDILEGPVAGGFNAAYCLDVLEHIPKEHENTFMRNIAASIETDGVLIIGTPSAQSQAYASPQSKEGHVNCQTGQQLKSLAGKFFKNVFIFSMNDEVVHTGFSPMAHYLFALCCGKRNV
ncbi:hypothetical protein MNBD_NITROSPINAE02-642 [hydrothermal vent metagenome]|uniref:Uncharacterized protein n=1 Tax=hydrothermal vent metagenome TaxID=652676 RepID=A0A3B1CQA7_9ZZZZ